MRIESSIAATQFETLTQPLLGLPISRAWCGHGSALILELGAVNGRYRSGKSRGTGQYHDPVELARATGDADAEFDTGL